MGELKADSGSFKWGVSTTQTYFPKDNQNILMWTLMLLIGFVNILLRRMRILCADFWEGCFLPVKKV
jgi:hypothetical protein